MKSSLRELEFLSTAFDLKPTNKEGLISLANVLRDLQRLDEATGFYRLARRLHPTSDDAVRRCNAHR